MKNYAEFAEYAVEKKRFKNKSEAKEALSAVLDLIKEYLIEKGDTVSFRKFGRFRIFEVPSYKLKNKFTGKEIETSKFNKISFKPSSEFRKSIICK